MPRELPPAPGPGLAPVTAGVPAPVEAPVAGPGSAPAACCSPVTSAVMSDDDAAALARTLKALADPARLKLLALIAAHDGAEACVCDLIEPVGLSQPTVSHHLKVLTEAGLVTREKRGVWAWFALVPGALDALTGHLGSHLRARGGAAA
ncbi:ArsR/SmtB family transcription factor [Cellulomonas sp. URHB0016]